MNNKKIKIINLSIPTKKIFPKNYCINSISKSNISTSNFSSINPDKNIRNNESYEDNIIHVKNKFIFNSPPNKAYIANYNNNALNINNNSGEYRTEIKNKYYQNSTYDVSQNRSFVYIRKKGGNMNLNNKYKTIYSKNSIILNDYRKRIMKLFLSSFRDYYLAQNWFGRRFIEVYYTVSPTIVKLFGSKTWFNRFWRAVLDKKVVCLKSKGVSDKPYYDR